MSNSTFITSGPHPVPMYTTIDSVKVRLANKVQFQCDPNCVLDGELPNALLIQLIIDAETEVERDLCGRYAIPFQSIKTKTFGDLPEHSKRSFRMAVDMKSVMNVLETDFGRGTQVNAADYMENQAKHYSDYINKLLGRDAESENTDHKRYRFTPPLEGVLLAASNRSADDGFKGMISNSDSRRGHCNALTYAAEQVNDPSRTYLSNFSLDRPWRRG